MDRPAAIDRLARAVYADGSGALSQAEVGALNSQPDLAARVDRQVERIHLKALLCRPKPWEGREPTLQELIAWSMWQEKGLSGSRQILAMSAGISSELANLRDSFEETLPSMWRNMQGCKPKSKALVVWEREDSILEAQLWVHRASGRLRAVLEIRGWSARDYGSAAEAGAHWIVHQGIMDEDCIPNGKDKCQLTLVVRGCPEEKAEDLCRFIK